MIYNTLFLLSEKWDNNHCPRTKTVEENTRARFFFYQHTGYNIIVPLRSCAL